MHKVRYGVCGVAISMVALGGCSFSIGGSDSVPKETVEEQIGQRLTAQVGTQPESVTCPDDLEAEQDATMRCELEADDGSTIGVTVTVTSVQDGNAKFDIEVDESPSSGS